MNMLIWDQAPTVPKKMLAPAACCSMLRHASGCWGSENPTLSNHTATTTIVEAIQMPLRSVYTVT